MIILHNLSKLATPYILSADLPIQDRKSTRLNSSHSQISYAVFCLKKKIHIDFRNRTDALAIVVAKRDATSRDDIASDVALRRHSRVPPVIVGLDPQRIFRSRILDV